MSRPETSRPNAESAFDASRSSFATQERFQPTASRPESPQAFDALALVAGAGGVLSTGGDPISVVGGLVSGNFFTLLGLRAEVGRLLVADDEQPGHDDLVVISHALWVNRFSADRRVVGQRIVIAGKHAPAISTPSAFPSSVVDSVRTRTAPTRSP